MDTYFLKNRALTNVIIKVIYNYNHMKPLLHILSTFLNSVMQYKIAAMPMTNFGFKTTSEILYCVMLGLGIVVLLHFITKL